MKKILLTLAAIAMVFAGCTKGFEERLTNLENRVSELEAFVTNLNSEVKGIQTIVSNLQKNVYVTGVEPIKNASGVEIGYKLTFNQGNPIEIKHGNTGAIGETGATGKTPTIDLGDDGQWYWRYSGGDWILDSNDNKIPVYKNIEFEIDENGHLLLYVNDTYTADLGKVEGEQGPQGEPGQAGAPGAPGAPGAAGDSWFEKVTVDEAAGTVTIDIVGTDNDLVLPFNAAAAEEKFELNLNLPANTEVVLGGTIEFSYTLVGCAAADAAVFVQAPEDWKVELNESTQKIVLTVGEKAGRVVVYAINNVTGEVRAKFVAYDPATMLVVNVENTKFFLDPTGGEFTIPVSTGIAYKVDNSTWLTVTKAPATKAVEHTVLTVTAGENASSSPREGEVNIWTADGSKLLLSITVKQNNYDPALLFDGEGNPIEWQETFKLFASGTEKASYKNVFTISLSDDFTKGTYKITNMFYAASFYAANGQPLSNQGGDYYADLDGSTSTLTVYRENSNKSYGFTNDVKLTYDSENKTFSIAEPINVGYIAGMGNNIMLTDYTVKVKVDEPLPSTDWSSLYGVYNESTRAPYASSSVPTETLVISESDNSDYDLKMLFFYTNGESNNSYDTAYGKVAADGKSITVTIPNASNFCGPVSDFVLNVNGNTISGSYAGQCDYSASKPASFDPSSLYGEWSETTKAPYSTGAEETLLISESDNSDYDLKMLFYYTAGQTTHEVGYGKVNADGTQITVTFITDSILGPVNGDVVFTISGNTISGTISTQYMGSVEYSASKPEPFKPSSLYGEWSETTKAPYSTGAEETLLISESDNSDYDLKMLFYYTAGQTTHEVGYGKVNADGTQITVTFITDSILGPVNGDVVFTISGNTISGTISTQYMGSVEYSATR